MDKGRYVLVCVGPGKELIRPADKSMSPHNEKIMRVVLVSESYTSPHNEKIMTGVLLREGTDRITWKKHVSTQRGDNESYKVHISE